MRAGRGGQYFSLGVPEAFLLQRLDGVTPFQRLQDEFEKQFDEPVSREDIEEFLEIAAGRSLLKDDGSIAATGKGSRQAAGPQDDEDEDDDPVMTGRARGSLLYYRVRLFDPDDKFTRWERWLRWVWTPGFAVVSGLAMLLALLTMWANRSELIASVPEAMRWQTVVLGAVTIFIATMIHEYGHGLTCKHFGGEVREVGLLFMFFMPCLYCNVSDAWLIRERWKRMVITAAGGYADLCLWAASVFVWRVTVTGTLVNHLAFVLLTVCGGRGFINFNPLLRLDGYYLLSDAVRIPNLRARALEYWMSHVRWILWGAPRPERLPKGPFLIGYGVMTWVFALSFLNIVVWKMILYLGKEFGWLGLVFTCLLLFFAWRRVFRGFLHTEFSKMIHERPFRTMAWGGALAAGVVALFVVPIRHYAGGEFEVRPGTVVQVQSPVSGIVSKVFVEDGARVSAGDPIAQLIAPDVDSQVAAKNAELAEVDAGLAKLRTGARQEELQEKRKQVARLAQWCEQGQQDVEFATKAHRQQLIILDQRYQEAKAESDLARSIVAQAEQLYRQGAVAGLQLRSEQTQLSQYLSRTSQAQAAYELARVQGVRDAESDLIRREQEFANAQATLRIMEAGTRPEEIRAEESRRERIQQQLEYLRFQQERLLIRATSAGVISTPRMQEKVGNLLVPGMILCSIEDGSTSHVELAVNEEEARDLAVGMPVSLKARSLPFETFQAQVERISTAAIREPTGVRNRIVVHCQLANSAGLLKSGMGGFGRVYRGWRSAGLVMLGKTFNYLRTEFWW